MMARNVVTRRTVMNDIAADPVVLSDDDERSQTSNLNNLVPALSQDNLETDVNEDELPGHLPDTEIEDGEVVDIELQQRKRVSFDPSVPLTTATGNTYFRQNTLIHTRQRNKRKIT